MTSAQKDPKTHNDSEACLQFESGMVSVFAELADLFGNPRSHGQIYGLLFSSSEPLTMEDIARRTGISMGSVSVGLRALENFGAITRDNSERFAHYSARLELKTLIDGFIHNRLVPKLEKSNTTLKDLAGLLDTMTPENAQQAAFRLQRVTQWHTRASQFLPLAEKILLSASKILGKPGGR